MRHKSIKKRLAPQSRIVNDMQVGLSATRIVLQDIASLLGGAAYAAGHNYTMGWAEYEDLMERKREYEEREYLRDLRRRKFVQTKTIGQKLMVRLTEKGWQQVLRDRVRCTRAKCKDGICFVIFDVPETERRVRDTLRGVLSECGFEMIQKSVWATNRDVLKPLCALLQGANLHKWVRIMVGNEIKQALIQRTLTRIQARFA